MTASSEPVHLNNHHRTTLEKIFQHPVNHNIEWNDVLSLLNAVATVEEKHDGKFGVTLVDVTETIERHYFGELHRLAQQNRNPGYSPFDRPDSDPPF